MRAAQGAHLFTKLKNRKERGGLRVRAVYVIGSLMVLYIDRRSREKHQQYHQKRISALSGVSGKRTKGVEGKVGGRKRLATE
jgi:hypothetical protein